jgi:DNA-binding transcriptional LysR family regulator
MQQGKIRRYLKHGMLPQLRVFEAVARHGSFTRAAEELYLAQPTVSVQIRKLTDTVGLPLLEQIGKRVHPTAVGRELYAACQEIFRTLDGVESALSDIRGLKAGSLRVATSTSGKYLVPRLLAEFSKLHPGIEISLHVNGRESVLDRLADNRDDLYVLSNPPEEDDVVVQRISANPLVVFARAEHPLARERKIPFALFASEPLLMREPGSGTRMITERLYARHGLEPLIGMELGSNEAIRETMLAGLGTAILYRYSLGLGPDFGRLAVLDVEGFPVESHWHLVYPVGKRLSFVTETFMEFARKEAPRVMADANGKTRH